MIPRTSSLDTRPSGYRGRFAPSPTGPLHFGSLVAAVASFLEARRHGGQWLVRMEDLDPPREVPGAGDAILRALEAYGLEWDGAVLYQSERGQAYAAALQALRAEGLLYACACTRKEIAAARGPGRPPDYYPGTCRGGPPSGRRGRTLRVLTEQARIEFEDALQGPQSEDLEEQVGDFVLRRADGLFAYQLAVVVDDAHQGITHVMRGADLLDSTARQVYLQHLLGLATPHYAHLPVAVNTAGEKLSKQTGARPLDAADPVPGLWAALAFLGQAPPPELRRANLHELWDWARARWDPGAIARCRARPLERGAGAPGPPPGGAGSNAER